MTVAVAGGAPPRAPSPNWSMIGVLSGIATAVIGAISAYATLTAQVQQLRAEIPPGAIAKLEERSEQQQAALVEIRDALRNLERRP